MDEKCSARKRRIGRSKLAQDLVLWSEIQFQKAPFLWISHCRINRKPHTPALSECRSFHVWTNRMRLPSPIYHSEVEDICLKCTCVSSGRKKKLQLTITGLRNIGCIEIPASYKSRASVDNVEFIFVLTNYTRFPTGCHRAYFHWMITYFYCVDQIPLLLS